MPLNDDDREYLNASAELAEFYKTLSLLAYTAVDYVASGSTAAEKIANAQAATAAFLPLMHTMSGSKGGPPGSNCYWDPVLGQIVCPLEASETAA